MHALPLSDSVKFGTATPYVSRPYDPVDPRTAIKMEKGHQGAPEQLIPLMALRFEVSYQLSGKSHKVPARGTLPP